MQKIIPFKQEKDFKDSVFEITSISLEHTLHKEKDNLITGEFLVSGDYKVVETSSVIDTFSFRFPFDIHLDEKYDLDKIQIDIDDFYYEIKNNKSLVVNIDVLLDKIEEKEILDRNLEEEKVSEKINFVPVEREVFDITKEETEETENPVIIKETKQELIIDEKNDNINRNNLNKSASTNNEDITSIFDNVENSSKSSIYKVYIVREEDTLMTIMENYNITKDKLEKYNNLKEIKRGDKIIIPCE